jgi:hypothetical protein
LRRRDSAPKPAQTGHGDRAAADQNTEKPANSGASSSVSGNVKNNRLGGGRDKDRTCDPCHFAVRAAADTVSSKRISFSSRIFITFFRVAKVVAIDINPVRKISHRIADFLSAILRFIES